MNVLVTGGCGFLGSHVIDKILSSNNLNLDINIVDDLSTGNLNNIQHLLDENKINQLHLKRIQDLNNNEVEECDIILHFAASVGVKNIVSSPHQTLLNNIESTIGTLDIARQSKSCRAFIFISTSEVYGEGQHRIDNRGRLIPFSEHDQMIVGNLDHLRWSYPAAKAMDEFLVKSFCEENDINYVILRPFNVSGPRQTGEYGMVIPKFVDLALTNKDIPIYENGKQVRTFTHVFDFSKIFVKIMESVINNSNKYHICNIASPHYCTINELTNMIINETSSLSKIQRDVDIYKKYGKAFQDTHTRIADIDMMRSLIGPHKFKNISDIVSDVTSYIKEGNIHGNRD
jgi:UDP-glucose 4-epimerase